MMQSCVMDAVNTQYLGFVGNVLNVLITTCVHFVTMVTNIHQDTDFIELQIHQVRGTYTFCTISFNPYLLH